MRHIYDDARRIAHNTLEEANRHLNSGKIRNPRHHQMLTAMIKDATATLDNLNRMDDDDRSPYKNTNIGYHTDARRQKTYADTNDLVNDAMDLVDRILPHIADDDRYDVDDRRGVPGTGRRRVRRVRADRYENRYDDKYDTNDRYDDRYDDDRYETDDDRYDEVDDMRVYNMPRWRSARTGRFLPNLYGPRRVRRVRRSDMDDKYDTSDRYDDDRYDDARYDDRYPRNDHERRMHEAITRTAADTARRMVDDRRTSDDKYPGTPVMRDDRRTRDDRTDRRYDDRTDADDAHRPGPDMRTMR